MESKNITIDSLCVEKEHLEKLPVPMAVYHEVDGKYTLILVTDGLCRLLGRKREDVIRETQENYACYIHTDDYAEKADVSDFMHSTQAGTPYRLQRADGEYVWVSCNDSIERTDNKTTFFYRVYSIVSDVQEKAISPEPQSTERFGIIDNIPVGVCVCELREGEMVIVEVNNALLGYVNLPSENIVGHAFGELAECFHPDEVLSLKQDEIDFLQGRREFYKAYRLRTPKGYIWFRLLANCIEFDGHRYIFMTFTDISRAKAAAKSDVIARRAYETAVTSAGMLVWKYDVKDNVLSFMDNRTTRNFCVRTGMPMVIYNVPYSLFHFVTRESASDILRLYHDMSNGKISTCTLCFNCLDGSQFYEEMNCTFIDQDNASNLIAYGIGHDVTEKKERELVYEREIRLLHQANRSDVVAKGHYSLTENRVLDYAAHTDFALDIAASMTFDEAAGVLIEAVIDQKVRDEMQKKFTREALLEMFAGGVHEIEFEYNRKKEGKPAIFLELTVNLFETHNGNVECFVYGYDASKKAAIE